MEEWQIRRNINKAQNSLERIHRTLDVVAKQVNMIYSSPRPFKDQCQLNLFKQSGVKVV